jgi:hypothetical protein
MVDPALMCRAHLLGEHRELHALTGMLKKRISLDGYYQNKLLQLPSLGERHEALVKEMQARGYAHHSPLPNVSKQIAREPEQPPVDIVWSWLELMRRCPNCRKQSKVAKS